MFNTLSNTRNKQFVLLLSVAGKYIYIFHIKFFLLFHTFDHSASIAASYWKTLQMIGNGLPWHTRNFSYCFLSCCKRIVEKYTLRVFSKFSLDGSLLKYIIYVFVIVVRAFKHGVIILNRSNNCVKNILKPASFWSHPRFENLNETRNASSAALFLKILNPIFQSINMGLDHKLFLQLFLIGFYLDKYRDFI